MIDLGAEPGGRSIDGEAEEVDAGIDMEAEGMAEGCEGHEGIDVA
jgi:hypothetical protein